MPVKSVLRGMSNKPNRHINFLNEEDQRKWLVQRGWEPDGVMYRDPDTGTRYSFPVALRMAKESCRIPADFELNP